MFIVFFPSSRNIGESFFLQKKRLAVIFVAMYVGLSIFISLVLFFIFFQEYVLDFSNALFMFIEFYRPVLIEIRIGYV